jgi:outer membrane protein assembly factor BamB
MAWKAETMRASNLVFATLLALTLGGCGTVGGWFGMGETSTKVKPSPLAEFKATASLTRAWEVGVGPSRPYVFSPGGDGQSVFAAGKDGRIVRIDLSSGREVWRIETGKPLSAGVGVGDGLVLAGTPKGEVLAFQVADGKLAWSAMLGGEILSTPVVMAGRVAVRTIEGRVTLLNTRDGKKQWSAGRTLPSLVLRDASDLLLTDKAVFVGYPGGKLLALSLANGAAVWEANVAQPRGATEIERIADVTGTLIADERMVCGVAYQGRLSCFDQANGNPVWSREFSGLTGVAQDSNALYAVDVKDSLQAFDKQRGSATWKHAALGNRQLTTPLPLGRFVALADIEGMLHLFQSDNGAYAARAATDGSPVTGRLLPLSNGLVVQTANGAVQAFKIQ